MEIHHIVPRNQGGGDDVDNLIPLCFDCHQEVGSYNPKHPKGNRYTEKELKARRDAFYQRVKDGKLSDEDMSSASFEESDKIRRLNIEKDFHAIYMFILEYTMTPPTQLFMEIDRLLELYIPDSFFAQSNLLETMEALGDILATETSPERRAINMASPVAEEINRLKHDFLVEYKRIFFGGIAQ